MLNIETNDGREIAAAVLVEIKPVVNKVYDAVDDGITPCEAKQRIRSAVEAALEKLSPEQAHSLLVYTMVGAMMQTLQDRALREITNYFVEQLHAQQRNN